MISPTLLGVLSEIRRNTGNVEYQNALDQAVSLLDPKADHELTAGELEAKYTGSNGWGENPDWPRQLWREEVMNENTQCGYWEWMFNNIQSELHDETDSHQGNNAGR